MITKPADGTGLWGGGRWVWPVLCLAMAALQYLRGAYAEGAIFTIVPILLIIDQRGGLSRLPLPDRWLPPLPPLPALVIAGVAVGIPIALAPRYSLVLAVFVGAAGLAVAVLAWPRARLPILPEPGPALSRGTVVWPVVCAVACALEVSAFLLSLPSEEARAAHPAVSDLIGPLLDTDPGRLAFAAAWVAGGIALLRRGARHSPVVQPDPEGLR